MDDFAAASEDEQAARLAGLAREALRAWDGGEDARLDLIKYRENAVFRVTERDGTRSVLRVHRAGYRSDDEIRSEVAWMRALAADGIPTPEVLPTRGGDVLAVAQGPGVPGPRQCDRLGWVEGCPLGTLEQGVALGEGALRRTYRTVGEIAARVHAHGAAWRKPPGFVRPAWDVDALVGDRPTFGRFWELEEVPPATRELLLRARDRARAGLAAAGPADALVHGDLIPDNLLVGGGEVRLIDFDDCGWSWVGFELATSLFPLLAGGGFDAGLQGILEGYRANRRLPEAQLALMPHFLVARALSYLGWPAGRPEIHSQRGVVPFFAERLAELARHYLDAAP